MPKWIELGFWATICKTVCPMLSDRRPMLSDRYPVCLSCLSVCDVGVLCQTVGEMKMKLGTEVGLGSGHIVLDGDPASPPNRAQPPNFLAHVRCGQVAGLIKMPLVREVGLSPSDNVLDGDPAPLPKRRRSPPPPNFRPMSVVTRRLDGSRCHLAWN